MGSVGKDIERIGQGVGGFLGINPNTKLGKGGSFSITPEAAEAEKEALQRLRDVAAGKAPSVTELQYKQAMDDITRQQQSAAASARGVSNVGLLQRQAMIGSQQAQQELAQQAAAAKLAEQRSAEGLLLGQASAQRGVAQSAAASQLAAEQEASKTRGDFISSLAASGAKVATGGGASSDINSKTNIEPNENEASKTISEFMDALKSYTYEYKKSAKQPNGKPNPEGKVKSVMAQDLEKTDLGKQMVTDTPDGKVVDYAQGMAPLLAAIAELNKRTKKLEGK